MQRRNAAPQSLSPPVLRLPGSSPRFGWSRGCLYFPEGLGLGGGRGRPRRAREQSFLRQGGVVRGTKDWGPEDLDASGPGIEWGNLVCPA